MSETPARPGWPADGIIRSLADIDALPEPDRTRVQRLRLGGQAGAVRRIEQAEGTAAAEAALASIADVEGQAVADRVRTLAAKRSSGAESEPEGQARTY